MSVETSYSQVMQTKYRDNIDESVFFFIYQNKMVKRGTESNNRSGV